MKSSKLIIIMVLAMVLSFYLLSGVSAQYSLPAIQPGQAHVIPQPQQPDVAFQIISEFNKTIRMFGSAMISMLGIFGLLIAYIYKSGLKSIKETTAAKILTVDVKADGAQKDVDDAFHQINKLKEQALTVPVHAELCRNKGGGG